MRTAVLALVTLLLVASPAHAIPYETFVDVDDEGDLQDLLAAGTITQDTFDELLDLLNQGVDLTKADRGELYTLPNLTNIEEAAAVVKRVPASNAVSIVNPPKKAKQAYPISTFTYAIVPHDAPQKQYLQQFINYDITKGQAYGAALDFAPLPKVVVTAAKNAIASL